MSAQSTSPCRRLEESLSSRDASDFERAVLELEVQILEEDGLSHELFSCIASLLRKPLFLDKQGSWVLLRILQENWNALSVEQRRALAETMEEIYGRPADWMGSFMISLTFGESGIEAESLEALGRLSRSNEQKPRALVAVGLEKLVRRSTVSDVRERAIRILESLANDASSEVSREAKEALGRVVGRESQA
jgi:hypothetical protein